MRGLRLPAPVCFAAALAIALGAAAGDARASDEKFADLKGEFEFGMTPQQVVDVLSEEIREQYAEKIQSTRNVYRQDQLRRKRRREIARIKKTYIQFEGEKTGWDVSLIDDQFAHNTGESMLVRWETDPRSGEDRRRFFFFHQGRLYKMLIAHNPSGTDRPFSYFQGLMQRRFGRGDVAYEEDAEGNQVPVAIGWRSRSYVVRALNKLEFYGSFCLMIADRESAERVAQIREANREPDAEAEFEDFVATDPDESTPDIEERDHVVDEIIRQR